MKQEKHDRRSQRTRHLVHAALMELLLEKRYEAITVRDILNRAGIGSSTFYTHYFDKEDVQVDVIEQMLSQLLPSMAQATAEQTMLPSLALFRHIQEHSQHSHFRALMRDHGEERVWEMLRTSLSSIIEQTLASDDAATKALSVPRKVVASYLSGAFLNLLTWWIKSEMPYSAEQMDEIFQQLALPGVRMVMKGKSE